MNEDTGFTTSATVTLADETVLNLTSDEICVKTNRFSDGAGSTSFPVGEAMSRTMQIEINNEEDDYSDYDFLGAVVWLYLDYGEESITIGKYTVISPASYGETVIIQAQDDMYKADAPFSTSLTYPTTAGALWAEICASCGISNGMSTIPQANFPISTAPSTSLTYRAVIGYIAMLSGGNARIDRNGSLTIVTYDMDALEAARSGGGGGASATDEGRGDIVTSGLSVTADGGNITITGGVFTDGGRGEIVWTASGEWDIHNLDMWHSLKVDASDTEITGVQTTVRDDSGGTRVIRAGSRAYALQLTNPLWEGNELAAVTYIKNELAGVPFRGFSGEYIAYPLAEFGDIAKITDVKGNEYYTFITDLDFTWSAATVMKCVTQSATNNDTSSAAQTSELVKTITNILSVAGINADWIRTGSLLADLIKLYGAMSVYKTDTFTSANLGGQIGFTSGNAQSNIEQGIVQVSQNYNGVCIVGNNGVFIGFHGSGDVYYDGGDIKINDANYPTNIYFKEKGLMGEGGLEINGDYITINGRDVLGEIGTLSSLTTTATGSLVAAINELESRITALGG